MCIKYYYDAINVNNTITVKFWCNTDYTDLHIDFYKRGSTGSSFAGFFMNSNDKIVFYLNGKYTWHL